MCGFEILPRYWSLNIRGRSGARDQQWHPTWLLVAGLSIFWDTVLESWGPCKGKWRWPKVANLRALKHRSGAAICFHRLTPCQPVAELCGSHVNNEDTLNHIFRITSSTQNLSIQALPDQTDPFSGFITNECQPRIKENNWPLRWSTSSGLWSNLGLTFSIKHGFTAHVYIYVYIQDALAG